MNLFIPLLVPVAVLVNFRQPMYSVVEGNTISVGVVADRRSDLPFIVTVKANGVGGGEGERCRVRGKGKEKGSKRGWEVNWIFEIEEQSL